MNLTVAVQLLLRLLRLLFAVVERSRAGMVRGGIEYGNNDIQECI